MKSRRRLAASLAGAGLLGGVLAAAGEFYVAAAVNGAGVWGVPRFFYQLVFGAEAAWLGLGAATVFAASGLLYFRLVAPRLKNTAAFAPARLAVLVAATGAAFGRFLATADYPWFYEYRWLTVAVGVAAVAAWALASWTGYTLWELARPAARRRAPRVALRVLAVALLGPAAALELAALVRDARPGPHAPDIYLVVMDAFRADRLGAAGGPPGLTPNLDALAADAVVFTRAYSASSWTKAAVASLFTSSYPSTHRVVSPYTSLSAAATTLAEALRAGGYRTVAVSANHNVSRPLGMADGFDVFDSTSVDSVFSAGGPAVSLTRLPRFLRRRDWVWGPTSDGFLLNRRLALWRRWVPGPRFFYLHYMEPHAPNPVRPENRAALKPLLDHVDAKRVLALSGPAYYVENILVDPAFRPDFNDDELALARALYDADVKRMDAVVGELLRASGAMAKGDDGPVVVVIADHGEAFLEHGRWLHSTNMHAEVARIPLLIKVPSGRRARVNVPVNLVDLAPTIVSLAGGLAPAAWVGRDLAGAVMGGPGPPPRPLLLEGTEVFNPTAPDDLRFRIELWGVVDGDYYYLTDENAGREYLYDEVRDPRQERNLATSPDPAHQRLRDEYRRELAALRADAAAHAYEPGKVVLSPSVVRALRAVGYLGGRPAGAARR